MPGVPDGVCWRGNICGEAFETPQSISLQAMLLHGRSNARVPSHPTLALSRSTKVVGHAEMMEMLSNYDYTIDLTSDADGAAETWGPDGGYGIISASQMLAWVAANCGEACPGETKGNTACPIMPPKNKAD